MGMGTASGLSRLGLFAQPGIATPREWGWAQEFLPNWHVVPDSPGIATPREWGWALNNCFIPMILSLKPGIATPREWGWAPMVMLGYLVFRRISLASLRPVNGDGQGKL